MAAAPQFINELLLQIIGDITEVGNEENREAKMRKKAGPPVQHRILPILAEAGLAVISSNHPTPSVSIAQIRTLKQNKVMWFIC